MSQNTCGRQSETQQWKIQSILFQYIAISIRFLFYLLMFVSVADTTFDDSMANDENANPNVTVRIQLRSGEIRSKGGISQKLVVAETRTPKRRIIKSGNEANQVGAQHSAGPSGQPELADSSTLDQKKGK